MLARFALCALLGATLPAAATTADRIALVIGNATYGAATLKNPVNDARAVARSLRAIGFQVQEHADLELEPMIDAMNDFLERSLTAQVRLLYYAGHGSQYRGRNFLLPAKAALRSEDDLERKALNASAIFERLGGVKSGVSIVIVDACRDTPFPTVALGRSRTLEDAKALPTGFAPTAPVHGTIIAFSTAPGKIAYDGAGQHSTYTKHLLANLTQPGLPFEGLLKRVRSGVIDETAHKQVPWETSSLVGDFCFVANGEGGCSLVATPPPRPVAEPAGAARNAARAPKR